jgi:dCMP deaminase
LERRDKTNYYLDIAETVLGRSTCLRRIFGAIIVKNDEIISTGYNGAPRGRINCCDTGYCIREKLNIPKGQRYELCRSVHAEANAIISASRNELINSTLYLACHDAKSNSIDGNVEPCSMCKRLILNAGIKKVMIRKDKNNFKEINVSDWIENDESLTENNGY